MHPTRKLLVLPRSTYYESDQRQGASLIRARKPFLIKNVITGLVMFGITASIYVYTIRAVSQDEFEDVKVPDAPGRGGGSKEVGGK